MDRYYPPIDKDTVLNIGLIGRQITEDPQYLMHEECPYDVDTKVRIERMIGVAKSATIEQPSNFEDKWEKLEFETNKLMDDLKTFGNTMDVTDVAERMSYFRTSTSLLDKIVTLQERAMGLKQISEFQAAVMDILETTMTPTQRTEVMEKLREFSRSK